MKVILKEDVRKLGKKGEVVEVSDGYGQNYLIARGLATLATDKTLKAKAAKDDADNRRDARLTKEAQEQADRLRGKTVRVTVTAGEGGRVFGSVTTGNVADAMQEQYDLKVDKKKIKLDETPKNLGSYPVVIKLHGTVDVKMTLLVEEK